MENDVNETNNDRRDFLKKATYVAPAVVTLAALPSIAQSASSSDTNNGDSGPITGPY